MAENIDHMLHGFVCLKVALTVLLAIFQNFESVLPLEPGSFHG